MIKVTTKSGRQYLVDVENQFWRRLPKTEGGYTMSWDRLWSLQKGTHFDWPSRSPEGTWEEGLPEVGKFMYVSSRDQWWTTTEVVSIEEVEE